MTIEQGLAVGGFAITATGVLVNALWLMRRVTQSEAEIKNKIEGVQIALGHQNTISDMRHKENNDRIQRLEQNFASVTKVVIFAPPDGKATA